MPKKSEVWSAVRAAVAEEAGIDPQEVSDKYMVEGRALTLSVLENAHRRLGLPGDGGYQVFSNGPFSLVELVCKFDYEED